MQLDNISASRERGLRAIAAASDHLLPALTLDLGAANQTQRTALVADLTSARRDIQRAASALEAYTGGTTERNHAAITAWSMRNAADFLGSILRGSASTGGTHAVGTTIERTYGSHIGLEAVYEGARALVAAPREARRAPHAHDATLAWSPSDFLREARGTVATVLRS